MDSSVLGTIDDSMGCAILNSAGTPDLVMLSRSDDSTLKHNPTYVTYDVTKA